MAVARFQRLEAAPAYRTVAASIEREIVAGRIKPGDQLPTEMALAETFGVNRSTVREGIRLLEDGGMIERRNGKRLYVSLPHFQTLASRATRALVVHEVTFRELWEASMPLEPEIAFYAAERITPGEIEDLRANLAAMSAARDDTELFVKLDMEFHELLAKATKNRVFILAREPISLLFLPAGKIILPQLRTEQRVVDAHGELIAMLERRDAVGARTWMMKHMVDFKRAYDRTGLDLDMPLYAAMQRSKELYASEEAAKTAPRASRKAAARKPNAA